MLEFRKVHHLKYLFIMPTKNNSTKSCLKNKRLARRIYEAKIINIINITIINIKIT